MRGKSMPYSPCSSSFQAAPMPSSIRPPEMWSIVVAMLATTAGWRYVTPETMIPQARCVVCAAIAASSVKPSKHGPVGSDWIGWKWSKTDAQSSPTSSANFQIAR